MAKSKRSKHMRAMRRLLREKLSKKDEAKRLAAMKQDQLIPAKASMPDASKVEEEMQVGGSGAGSEFNSRTLKNKEGQFPPWLSGRQRKRLQAKHAIQKKTEKKKQTKSAPGKVTKRKAQKKKVLSDKPETMST